ncbi:MAG: PAS domain S-box protein [Bacteroidales bacterium]
MKELAAELENIKLLMKKRELMSILDNSFNMIANIDLDGRIIFCNEAYHEILGFHKDELIDTSFYNLLHPSERSKIKEQIFTQLLKESRGKAESLLLTKEGYYKFAEHKYRLLPGNINGKDTIVISSQDNTEKRRSDLVLKVQRNLANSVVSSNSFSDYYNTIVRELNTIMEVNNLFIAFYDEDRVMLKVTGMTDENERIETFPENLSLTGYMLRGGKAAIYYYDDIIELNREGKVSLMGTVSQVWLGSPIKCGDVITGGIVIQNYNSKEAFSKLDLEIIEIVANEIANFMEIKSAEEASHKLNIAVIQSPASVLITDASGKIEFVNPKFSELTGYEINEVIGSNPKILNSGTHSKEMFNNLWRTISSGGEWRGEIKNKKKNGEFYWEDVSISPIFNDEGKIINYVGVKEDITDRKKLIGDLIEAKERAEESDRLKTAFLQNISHEIRTPMNSIMGFIELLQDPDTTGDESREYIEIIEKSGNRMLGTINDIINISKIEAGIVSLSIGEVDMKGLLYEIAGVFKPEVDKKGMHIITDIPDSSQKDIIKGDQEKIYAIYSNLVKNAIKYSYEGTITIGYRIFRDHAECFVKDTGIGISKEKQEKIFERFTRIEESKSVEGAGIGLSIVKGYLDLMNGKISLNSIPGEGSEFIFTIPFRASQFD